ncbi:hypothetical protein DsansV1_C07g0071941 [Dioscorea sansibarensis]
MCSSGMFPFLFIVGCKNLPSFGVFLFIFYLIGSLLLGNTIKLVGALGLFHNVFSCITVRHFLLL